MRYRAYQIGLGQQLETPDFVMQHLPRHAAWGYNTLLLYLEGAYRFPSHPSFAVEHAWTPAQMQAVVQCATSVGVGVIPTVPSLGHTAYFLQHPAYRQFDERREEQGEDGLPILSGQVCPSMDKSYRFFADLYRDIAPFCTAGYLHVSLDESLMLGVCSRCKSRVERIGYGGIFLEHLQRLHELVTGLGLRMAVWGDMFYYFPELIPRIPIDVTIFDWYYYPFDRLPRVELYNFRQVDSARKLRRAGLEVWGCPNMGAFFREVSIRFQANVENVRSWWRYGQETDCTGLGITSWFNPFCTSELNVLGNAMAAECWLAPASDTATAMRQGIERMYGPEAHAALPILAALEQYPLVGNWHWQIITSSLDKMATLESPPRLAAEVTTLTKAAAAAEASGVPSAVRDTARVRSYYAVKEWLARAGSRMLFQARQAAAAGATRRYAHCLTTLHAMLDACERALPIAMTATESLWALSRPVTLANPLLTNMRRDAESYTRLRHFLAEATARPEQIFDTCDLLGARQLLVRVRNRRPCLQGLEVQVSTDGQQYRSLHRLYLLEFDAAAGQRVSNVIHTHAILLPDDLPINVPLYVRLKANGIGEVDIAQPVLLDGAIKRHPRRVTDTFGATTDADRLLDRGWATVGAPAPTKGFVTPEMQNSEQFITVEF
jgi:hypothetical protein